MRPLRNLLENYPALSHIGAEGEEQEEGTRKDITSLSQLRDVIEAVRTPRGEGDPIPKSGEFPLKLMFGFGDGETLAFDFYMIEKKEGLSIGVSRSDPQRFLDSKTQDVLAQKSDDSKAKVIFDRLDVEAIYEEMERHALQMLRKFRFQYALYQKCRVLYVTEGTASIQWLPKREIFVLRLNKAFLVYMAVKNLVNGSPKSTVSSLRQIYRTKGSFDVDTDMMAHTLLYVIMHEMGHIFYQHTGKHMGLYSKFDPWEVNVYGDMLINLHLTQLLGDGRNEVQSAMVPNIGLGKDRVLQGFVEDPEEASYRLQEVVEGIFRLDYGWDVLHGQLRRKKQPATALGVFSPARLTELEVPTFVLLEFFKKVQRALNLDPPPRKKKGKKKGEEKPPGPVQVTLPLKPGQIVEIDATGERGVVVAVGEPTPNPDQKGDYNQQVEVVPWSQLTPEVQKKITDMVNSITAPPMTRAPTEEEQQVESPAPHPETSLQP